MPDLRTPDSVPVIVGAGLAGCTLAWQMHLRGLPFLLIEDQPQAAGSLVAAGMLCPVTGKAFNPSWRVEEFYQPAREFYARVEQILGTTLWYDYPVVRPFFSAKDRRKFERKCAENPALAQWVDSVLESIPTAHAPDGAVVWRGSGRLHVEHYVQQSRQYFAQQGAYQQRAYQSTTDHRALFTTGARGLIHAQPVPLPHRSAKGEILTIQVPDLPQDSILSRGTWIVPTGNRDHTFLCGANYEWDSLDNTPTAAGRRSVEEGLRQLLALPYTVLDHRAGVRPIVRRSEPVIGTTAEGHAYLNGLGSKGTLYAPLTAHYLIQHLTGAQAPLPSYLTLTEE